MVLVSHPVAEANLGKEKGSQESKQNSQGLGVRLELVQCHFPLRLSPAIDWVALITDMYFSHFRETENFKNKVPVDAIPGKGPLPGLQVATILLHLHMTQRERCPYLIRTLVPRGGLTLLISFANPPSPNCNIRV